MRRTARVVHRDGYSLGQIAQQWGKTASFVQSLVSWGRLHPNERGLITTAELDRFYKESGELLHA